MPFSRPIGRRLAEAFGRTLERLGLRKETVGRPSVETRLRLVMDRGTMAIGNISRQLAEEFAADLRRMIERQMFAWVPLSTAWAKRKAALGLDPRILIATRRYVDSIQAVPLGGGVWGVGVPPEPLSPGSPYTLQDLARWFEWGTKYMPARPHWRLVMTVWRTKSYRVKQAMKGSLVSFLRRRGFR